jgi:alkylation response protein AidB-like acyl-CoA dehydrogenase
MREQDIFGLPFDVAQGGFGAGTGVFLDAITELARVCATTALTLALQERSLAIKLAGNCEQQQRFLPRLASGECFGAYRLDEAAIGLRRGKPANDRSARTRRLRVERQQLPHLDAGVAGLYTVVAVTEREAGHRCVSPLCRSHDTLPLR